MQCDVGTRRPPDMKEPHIQLLDESGCSCAWADARERTRALEYASLAIELT